MQFHAKSVSASADGDYYQIAFDSEESDEDEVDPYKVNGPYLIVQRQFEIPDGGRSYIEMHDEAYIGHFQLQLTELGPTRFAFDIGRRINNHIEVSFALNALQLEEVQRVAEIIFGLKEPETRRR